MILENEFSDLTLILSNVPILTVYCVTCVRPDVTDVTQELSGAATTKKNREEKHCEFSVNPKLLFSTALSRKTLELMCSLHHDVAFCLLFNTLGTWK